MKVDLTQPIKNFQGEPFQNDKGEPIQLGTIIRNLLGAPIKEDSGDQKLKKYKVGLKCVADEADLNEEDRTLIKELAGKKDMNLNPIIYGRIMDAMSDD